jgi:enterochelin esterase-like enzyme
MTMQLDSTQVGDRFKIYVSLPGGYDPDALPGYHVVFLLDGDWFFDGADQWMTAGGVVRIVTELTKRDTMPPVIVVGIGYGPLSQNSRERDFYHDPDTFYAFLKSELVPMIDREYNTISSPEGRILIGHSLGGYFVMYALLTHEIPDHTFHNIIAISGDYSSHEGKLFRTEQALYEQMGEDGLFDAALYLAVASGDSSWVVSSYREMKESMEGRGYRHLRFEGVEFGNHDHYSVVEPGIRYGLRWLFEQQ